MSDTPVEPVELEEIPEGTGICTGSEIEEPVEPEDYSDFELPEDLDE